MISTRISAKEARDKFTDLLGTVYYGKESVVIERKGRPFAVVVNPEEYEQYERYTKTAKKDLFKIVNAIQTKNKKVNYKNVSRDVARVVEEVRKERYERQTQAKSRN